MTTPLPETVMTVGTGGFGGSAAAGGPVAGLDPMLDFRKKMAKAIKDHPYAIDYKSKRKKAKAVKEGLDRHHHQVAHLYQYKVKIPTVGDTIIFGNSEAELRMKLRLLVNPRYQGALEVERIFPSAAGNFYNQKRIKAYKNLPEATMMKPMGPAPEESAGAGAKLAKQADAIKKQSAAQQVQAKVAIEKKKIDLKKQEMQKSLQMKISAMKKGAASGSTPVATESFMHESSGGNIYIIKKIADSNAPGSIDFLSGEKFQLQPAIAKKIFQAYESLGMQKNKAKFSNAANENAQSFNKILTFVGAAE